MVTVKMGYEYMVYARESHPGTPELYLGPLSAIDHEKLAADFYDLR